MSKAAIYLKAAAKNTANTKNLAVGLSNGGELREEWVGAIAELGHCFGSGWV